MRSIFITLFATLVTSLVVIFASIFITSAPVHAADPEATWTDGAISYDNRTYTNLTDKNVIKDLGLSDQAKIFISEEAAPLRVMIGGSSNSPPATYHVIYFDDGADLTTAGSAHYKTYELRVSGGTQSFSNPSAVKDITVDASTFGSTSGGSSCQVSGGLGWIICPLSDTLAGAMDWIYDQLSAFLEVQPLMFTDTNSGMYMAWNIARSIANLAFIIAFLFIIYSYLTQFGISNYGLKKMIPRLIIAAITVNISFYICAIAVDVSNILGYSVQDIFMSIRDDIFHSGATVTNGGEDWNWALLTTGILGGVVGAGGLALATGGDAIGFVWMLLPLLVGFILLAIVILLILAARQAIIVLLVIIAPLAFVAYLLPNTEKWFEKWRGVLITMLVFFPAFSLVFGGAQLAGAIILQNASGIAMIILGLAVQVAPLAIMPIILRFSGGVLGKIAGMVNDPRRGLLDRTKNWAGSRTEARKFSTMGKFRNRKNVVSSAREALEKAKAEGNPEAIKAARKHYNRTVARSRFRSTNAAARFASWSDYRNYRNQQLKEAGEGELEAYKHNRLTETVSGTRLIQRKATGHHASDEAKAFQQQIVDEMFAGKDTHVENLRMAKRLSNAERIKLQGLEGDARTEALRNMRVDNNWKFKSVSNAVMERAVHMDYESRVIASATAIAKDEQTQNYANAINTTGIQKKLDAAIDSGDTKAQANLETQLHHAQDLLKRAGGISKHGSTRALASAKAVIDDALNKAIKNIEDTSGIEAGDVLGLQNAFDKAVAENDLAAMVAFSNKLSNSADAGVKGLRAALRNLEDGKTSQGDALGPVDQNALNETITDFKQYMNASPVINSAAEDIATWSRDPAKRKLVEVGEDVEVWADLTATAFAGNKKSSQILAMQAGAMNKKRALDILNNPGAKANLKPSVIRMLEDFAKSDISTETYNERLNSGYYNDPNEKED